MIKFQYFGLLCIFYMLISCNNNNEVIIEGKYEFISEYKATILVGGYVGITERTFIIGEVFEGTDNGGKTISIRIAEHTELNDDCPNSWCYQELLDVPRIHLKLVEKFN